MKRLMILAVFFAVLFTAMPECGSFQLQQPGPEPGPGLEQGQDQGQGSEQTAKISPRIGLCTEFMRLKGQKRQKMIGLLKPIGNRIVREPFPWNTIEPEKGEYRWTAADSVVEDLRNAGIEILAVITSAPEWAGGRNIKTGSFPPESPEDFGRFVETFVTRYKGKIKYYELWNEPNIPRFWGGRQAKPEEFVALLQAGYSAGKKADPDAVFIMGGLTRLLMDRQFIREVFSLGGLKACDAVGIHLYPDDMETFAKQVRTFISALDKMNADNPIWVTETGWPSKELDMTKFMARLEERGISREKFLKSVALQRSVGRVFQFTEEELARAQDSSERKKELATYGLTEDALDKIIHSTALDKARHQVDSLHKLSAFIEKNPRLEKVFWYRLDDKFDSPLKQGNFGIVDVEGNVKQSYKVMVQ